MDRKQAVQDYKNRKTPRGIFALRCAAAGRVWVDSSPNLDAARNSVFFLLRNGLHTNRPLQQEWANRGPEAFEFEILETLKEDDLAPMAMRDLLKEKKQVWAERLAAEVLLPS